MRGTRPGLVQIVRDFLAADRLLRDLFARHRAGTLRFEDLRGLVGDDEHSVLFRLKERCHTAFRRTSGGDGVALAREALFDLAVGSLFHEAMKLRENYYQREVYGPRVRALRSRAGKDAALLFEEFDRLLAGVSARLEEGVREVQTLLAQTVEQLRLLLAVQRADGAVARFLIENQERATETFGSTSDALLTELYGSTADTYRLAGGSYLESGYYAAAVEAFEEAARLDGAGEPTPLLSYARGMDAYLRRDYATTLAGLSCWAGAGNPGEPSLLRLARDAVACVVRLAEGDDRAQLVADANALLKRLPEQGEVARAR
jgi:tetratricopeptide (TPR) repeat protein